MRRPSAGCSKGTGLAGFLVSAFLIAALHARPRLLTVLFNEEGSLATGARLVHGAIPDGELTLGIIAAGVKRPPFLRALLRKIAPVLRAFDSQRNGFGRLAFRIGA